MSLGPDDVLPGLGPRRGVPRLAATFDWSAVSLDGEQAFVLSRVDGRTTLAEILLMVPFTEAQTVTILQALLTHGAVEIPGLRRPTFPSLPSVAAGARAPIPVTPPIPQAARPVPPSAPGMAVLATAPPTPRAPAAAPAAIDLDLDREPVDLPPELCGRVDDLLARAAAHASPAALLGVADGADKKEIRRVYFRLSKEFHPDRYYGKRLGPYKRRLQQAFATLTDAVEQLVGK